MKTAASKALLRALAADKYESEETLHAHAFIENVTDARENGYDFACVECGMGIFDDSDSHETWCKLGAQR